jgi:hypothetical protein
MICFRSSILIALLQYFGASAGKQQKAKSKDSLAEYTWDQSFGLLFSFAPTCGEITII